MEISYVRSSCTGHEDRGMCIFLKQSSSPLNPPLPPCCLGALGGVGLGRFDLLVSGLRVEQTWQRNRVAFRPSPPKPGFHVRCFPRLQIHQAAVPGDPEFELEIREGGGLGLLSQTRLITGFFREVSELPSVKIMVVLTFGVALG